MHVSSMPSGRYERLTAASLLSLVERQNSVFSFMQLGEFIFRKPNITYKGVLVCNEHRQIDWEQELYGVLEDARYFRLFSFSRSRRESDGAPIV